MIRQWWDSWSRATDIKVLWPRIYAQAKSLHDAREAFYMHCSQAPAWNTHLTDAEIIAIVDGLEVPK